jgi:hypothetical protein
VNPDDPAVAEVIAQWKTIPGTVGICIMPKNDMASDPNET